MYRGVLVVMLMDSSSPLPIGSIDTVTKQLSDGSLREYVINGLLPERNYTVEVRGYYELLGPPETTTVIISGKLFSPNQSQAGILLSTIIYN